MALVQHVRHNGPRPMVRTTAGVKVSAARPALRVVERRRRAMRWLVIGGLVVFGLMIGAAWFQTQLARRQIVLDELDRQVRLESVRFDELRLERSTLLAPAKLMLRADQLGMRPVDTTKYLTVDAEVQAYVEMYAAQPRQSASERPADALEQIGAVKAAVGERP